MATRSNLHSGQVVDSAMKVHSALGPGLLESTYETCLAYELQKRGLLVLRQTPLPIIYDEVQLDAGLLINFHVVHLKDGIKRMVNNL